MKVALISVLLCLSLALAEHTFGKEATKLEGTDRASAECQIPKRHPPPVQEPPPPLSAVPPGWASILFLNSVTRTGVVRFHLSYSLQMSINIMQAINIGEPIAEQLCHKIFRDDLQSYLTRSNLRAKNFKCHVIPFEDNSGGLFAAEWSVSTSLLLGQSYYDKANPRITLNSLSTDVWPSIRHREEQLPRTNSVLPVR